MDDKLGILKKVDVRAIFPHEASNFNTWLSKKPNLDLLSNLIGIRLDFIKREAMAGKYRVDLLCRDCDTNNNVIIESQFGKTDHSHLGKLISYSSHYNASTIIWIVNEVRIEHERSIEWLNLNLGDTVNIFLIEFNLISIDSSRPAPVFYINSKPIGWINKVNRDPIEIEEITNELIKLEDLYNKVKFKSIVTFLDSHIKLGNKYAKFISENSHFEKNGLFNIYQKKYPEDSQKYLHSRLRRFKKDIIEWAKHNNYEINKHLNTDNTGRNKSNGIEYFMFTE